MTVYLPRSLSETLDLLAEHPYAVLAGGTTDLAPLWRKNGAVPETVVTLRNVPELRAVTADEHGLILGAMLCHADVAVSSLVQKHFPALAKAASSIGAPAVRNMGTLGGNVANASPAADLPPVLLAYDADVVLQSVNGQRRIPLSDFFTGYRRTARNAGELLVAIHLPFPPDGSKSDFVKFGARQAQACSKLSLAVRVDLEGNRVRAARFGAASLAATPLRLTDAENRLTGQALTDTSIVCAVDTACRSVTPIDDVRSTADYRRHLLGVALRRMLTELGKVVP